MAEAPRSIIVILVYVADDGTVTFEEPGTPIEELGDGAAEFTVTNTSSYVPPEEPEEPETPDMPDAPDTPETPAKPTPKPAAVPKTGDPASVLTGLGFALCGVALVLIGRRPRYRVKEGRSG